MNIKVLRKIVVLVFDSLLLGEGLRKHFSLSVLASLYKLIVFPLVGLLYLNRFGVMGVPFTVGMIFFALPTSTAIYVLSTQLKSDPELASSD